jgi:hypothetical protein
MNSGCRFVSCTSGARCKQATLERFAKVFNVSSTSESPEGAKAKSPGQRPGARGATASSPVGAKPFRYRPFRALFDAGLTFPGPCPGRSNGVPSGLIPVLRRTHVISSCGVLRHARSTPKSGPRTIK